MNPLSDRIARNGVVGYAGPSLAHETPGAKRPDGRRRADARRRPHARRPRRRPPSRQVHIVRSRAFRARRARRDHADLRQRAARRLARAARRATKLRLADSQFIVEAEATPPPSGLVACPVRFGLPASTRIVFQLGFDDSLLARDVPAASHDSRDLATLLRAAAALSSIRGLAQFDSAVAGLLLEAVSGQQGCAVGRAGAIRRHCALVECSRHCGRADRRRCAPPRAGQPRARCARSPRAIVVK